MTAHLYQRTASGTAAAKLAQLIKQAAADRSYQPAPETKTLPLGDRTIGPTAAQGVGRVPFDPASPIGEKGNRIILDAVVPLLSNVALRVDSGVALVDGTGSTTGMISTTGASNWSLTPGDRSRNGGYWIADCSYQPRNLKSRLTHLQNSANFLVEYLDSVQAPHGEMTATTMLAFHSTGTPGPTTSPRDFIYRHHRNRGAGPGWGNNQVASAYHGWLEDLWGDGGCPCRLETDGGAAGCHDLHVEQVYGQNGSHVLVLSPHAAKSDHVTVHGVYGVSNYAGVSLVPGDTTAGVFTETTVDTGCIVGGHTAQNPVRTNNIADTAQVYAAQRAVNQVGPTPGITLTGITRSLTGFATAQPGGTPSDACTSAYAEGQHTP